ncbi:MAG TPA: peptidoglycan-binding protein [Bacillales bacterium]|nr:peptidoglycan-binding protein [Bacillales bacterium]
MKGNQKLKTVVMSSALTGIMAVAPMVTHASGFGENTWIKGDHGKQIKPLQKILKKFDYYEDDIDGIFGPHTYEAVNALQLDYDLNQDGIIGPETKQTLKQVLEYKKAYEKAPKLELGDRGHTVKVLQTQLKALDYYLGDLDGIFGPLTENAVEGFQKANDVAVDGIAGPKTYKALLHNPVPATKVESASTSVSESSSSDETVSRGTDVSADKVLYVESTAYTANCAGCSGITATGINLLENPGAKVIAVDPDVIPLGSTVWVEGYGYAVAGDTGGAIDGNRIDVFFADRSDALNWGRKEVKVKIVD